MRTAKTLIRLGGCPGWFESSLGARVILLVLSWGGSNHFFPGARMVDLLPLLFWEKDFDCVIENLVLNLSLIYWKMNRGLHDILWFRLLLIVPISISLLYHNMMLHLDKQPCQTNATFMILPGKAGRKIIIAFYNFVPKTFWKHLCFCRQNNKK